VTYRNSLPNKPYITSSCGGFFAIRKALWDRIKGMRTKYKRSQDLDFIIRLSEIGVEVIRLPILMVQHHTIDYRNESRMWELLFSGKFNYFSLFFRDHIFNMKVAKHTIRNNYTAFFLLLFPICFINVRILIAYLLIFILIVGTRVLLNTKSTSSKSKITYFFKRFIFQVLRDLQFWIAFLFFFPKSYKAEYRSL